MKIIYINYIDMNNVSAGSSTRPYNIYKAFLDRGYEVELVTGNISKDNIAERKEYLKNKLDIISQNDYDFCYIENMSGPLFKFYNKFEYDFIKEIKKRGIPIGVFYRDIYWKFSDDFFKRSLTNSILTICQKIDLRFWKKTCKTIFLPTESMNKYVGAKNFCVLPPACQKMELVDTGSVIDKSVIYVGGVTKAYGFYDLIDAFRIINDKEKIQLYIVCRKNDFDKVKQYLKEDDYKWLAIKHASGEELHSLYEQVSVSVAPLQKIEYYDFCMPVKIYEYVAHKKPIVCTDCNEMAKLVTDNKLGLVAKCNPNSIAENILKIFDNKDYNNYVNNMEEFAKTNHWVDRVDKINKELLRGNNEI